MHSLCEQSERIAAKTDHDDNGNKIAEVDSLSSRSCKPVPFMDKEFDRPGISKRNKRAASDRRPNSYSKEGG